MQGSYVRCVALRFFRRLIARSYYVLATLFGMRVALATPAATFISTFVGPCKARASSAVRTRLGCSAWHGGLCTLYSVLGAVLCCAGARCRRCGR